MKHSWIPTKLRDVLRSISRPVTVSPDKEYSLVGAHWYAKGLYVKEEKSGSEIQATTLFQIKEADFVYNRLFAWKGSFAVALNDVDGCFVSNEFPCFTTLDTLDPKFLWFYFSRPRIWDEALGLSSGSTPTSRNRLKEEQFLDMEVLLPPIEEQRRIVARIEELAVNVGDAKRLRTRASAESESLVDAAARQLLAGVKADVTILGDWLDAKREGIQTGPFGAQLGSTDFTDTGVPVLTIGNVQYGGLRLGGLKCVSPEKAAQLERYRIREGDLLFARMGTVGRCCVVPVEANDWLINYHIIRVALDRTRVKPEFLLWTIRASEDVARYLDDSIRGATRKGVNSAIVTHIPCRIPALNEQGNIVRYLSDLRVKVESLKARQSETAAELDALMPSILSKAFRGEL